MVQGIEIYKDNADQLSLEQFVEAHRLLVKKIALNIKRRLPSHIALEDLLQSGFVGLLEARANYKADRGASFETFAGIRIRGAIIDSLRKNAWGTRETLKNTRLINEAIARLEMRNQKPPTLSEIANELNITVEEYVVICQEISVSNVISLNTFENDTVTNPDEIENPRDIAERDQMITLIKDQLQYLSEREQFILSLYYIDDFTLKQIGDILDLSEARICQLHSDAILHIKKRVEGDYPTS